MHIDSINKNTLVLGEVPTQGLDIATKQQKLSILLILQDQENDLC